MRISIFILFLWSFSLMGQDLIKNGGFEEFVHCPAAINQSSLSLVKNWKQASRGTSDYFNRCSRMVGIPKNSFGHQEAKSGDAYLGLLSFSPAKRNYREYMQTKLITPLKSGQKYCVEFFVSLADNAQFMVDGLGIHFSKGKLKASNDRRISVKPQINNPTRNYLQNDNGWTLLSDVYIAKGGEQFITLGNFIADHELRIRKRNLDLEEDETLHDYAYYFIDELKVYPIDDRSECSCTFELIEKELADTSNWEKDNFKNVRVETVLFEFDDDLLSRSEQFKLNEVIKLMKDNPYIELEVVGHADIIGNEGYNDALSQKRADNVMNFLKDRGIGNDRIKINYFGSSKPIASNHTNEGRAQNRRVEFLIIEKAFQEYKH